MKTKKLLSWLLSGTIALSLTPYAVSANEELTTISTDIYSEDTTVFNETFDENMGEFVSTGRSTETIKYTDSQNHTAGKNAGAICMGLHGLGMSGFQQSAVYGVDRKIGGNIEVGKTYEVSAYIKGEPGRYKNGFKFAMGVYKFKTDINPTTLKDATGKGNVQITVTDDWQKIVYLWTPENTSENYSDYRIRINPVNGQSFNEKDENYDIFYIDDVVIQEKPEFKLVAVTPESGSVLQAPDSGITAEFSFPLAEIQTVTVRNAKNIQVPCTVTVDGVRLNVAIPNRDHGETYTVSFDNIISTDGDTLTLEETYTYTADQTIVNDTFDESIFPFTITDYQMAVPDCAEYTDKENHTEGKNAGSVRLGLYSDNKVYEFNSLSAGFGIDRKLGNGIEVGRSYVVSAYIKGEPGRYNRGFKFSMGIYKFKQGSYIQDMVNKYPVSITVNDEWQKIAFLWTPTDSSQNYADYSIRINPVNLQRFNGGSKENDNYDIFYIDDVSVMPVGNTAMAYLNDVNVTYVEGEETKTVSSAADMLGKALTVSCSIANLGANEQPYTVFAAVYNKAGKLVDIAGEEGIVAVEGKDVVIVTGLDLTNVTEDCVMKILVWDRSNNTQIPLTTVNIPF